MNVKTSWVIFRKHFVRCSVFTGFWVSKSFLTLVFVLCNRSYSRFTASEAQLSPRENKSGKHHVRTVEFLIWIKKY